jgi:hypothetical protein
LLILITLIEHGRLRFQIETAGRYGFEPAV